MGIISTYADKGSLARRQYQQTKTGGNSFVASSISNRNSLMRLIEAFRSDAPGGWSDDRWEQSKHMVGITYICCHRKGEQMAQAEFNVYIKDPKHPQGKREVTADDPPQGDRQVKPYDLVRLLERPNPEDSFGDLMYRWNMQMDLTGTALTWMLPNVLGVPMELYSVPTAMAIPQPVINPDFPKGFWRIQPIYPNGPFSSYPTPTSAAGAAVPGEWMLKFRYPHPFLPYDGYSPLTAMRLHIDEVEMIDKSRFYTMKRSVAPSAVLNFDEVEGMEGLPEPEIARIKAEWENEFQGVQNHGGIVVGTPGGKIEPWGHTPDKMLYEEGWGQLTSFIMAALGITKPAAGMIEDSSYSTLFATLKQLHLLTLEPQANRIASKLTRHLAPFFGDDLIIEIRCKKINDKDDMRSSLQILTQNQAITKGELRTSLDFPLTGEEWEKDVCGAQPEQPGGMPGMPGDPNAMGGDPNAMQQGQPGQEQPQQGDPNVDDVLNWKPQGGDEQVDDTDNPDGSPHVDDVLGWKPVDDGSDPEEEQETPGELGAGALGPRKHFLNGFHKSMGGGRWKKVADGYSYEKQGVVIRVANMSREVGRRQFNIGVVMSNGRVDWHEATTKLEDAKAEAEFMAEQEIKNRSGKHLLNGNHHTKTLTRKKVKSMYEQVREACNAW